MSPLPETDTDTRHSFKHSTTAVARQRPSGAIAQHNRRVALKGVPTLSTRKRGVGSQKGKAEGSTRGWQAHGWHAWQSGSQLRLSGRWQ